MEYCRGQWRAVQKPIFGRFFGLGLAGLLLLPAVLAQAQQPLTLESALELAGDFRPLNRELGARTDLAGARVERAGLWPNPSFEFSQERFEAGGSSTTQRFYTLSQQIDLSGQHRLEVKAAKARAERIRHSNDWQRLNHRSRVRRRFYALLLEQRRVEALEAALGRMDPVADIVSVRRRAGDISGYDQSRIERERADLKARLGEAQAERQQARQTLQALLGQSRDALAHTLAGTLKPDAPGPLSAYLERIKRRPDVKSLRAETSSAKHARQAAGRAWVPDPTLGVGFTSVAQQGADGGGLLFSVSMPLPAFDRGQAEAAMASARQRRTEARRQRLLDEAQARVRGLWRKTKSLQTSTQTFEASALTKARELTELAESAYRAGEQGILELLDAYRGQLEARLRALEMAHKTREAFIELNHASGGRRF